MLEGSATSRDRRLVSGPLKAFRAIEHFNFEMLYASHA
jgi:hypothetical protein